jgi:predicted enzyme involved in methoxymalonyl-ACP biosynthesis
VIGRDVETTMLADAAALARARGARVLSGRFAPTAKNAPASDVYARHAFEKCAETDAGSTWELDLTRQSLTVPEWIEVRTPS